MPLHYAYADMILECHLYSMLKYVQICKTVGVVLSLTPLILQTHIFILSVISLKDVQWPLPAMIHS